MSFQASSAVGLATSAFRRSAGSWCTTPPGTREALTEPRYRHRHGVHRWWNGCASRWRSLLRFSMAEQRRLPLRGRARCRGAGGCRVRHVAGHERGQRVREVRLGEARQHSVPGRRSLPFDAALDPVVQGPDIGVRVGARLGGQAQLPVAGRQLAFEPHQIRDQRPEHPPGLVRRLLQGAAALVEDGERGVVPDPVDEVRLQPEEVVADGDGVARRVLDRDHATIGDEPFRQLVAAGHLTEDEAEPRGGVVAAERDRRGHVAHVASLAQVRLLLAAAVVVREAPQEALLPLLRRPRRRPAPEVDERGGQGHVRPFGGTGPGPEPRARRPDHLLELLSPAPVPEGFQVVVEDERSRHPPGVDQQLRQLGLGVAPRRLFAEPMGVVVGRGRLAGDEAEPPHEAAALLLGLLDERVDPARERRAQIRQGDDPHR